MPLRRLVEPAYALKDTRGNVAASREDVRASIFVVVRPVFALS